MWTLVGMAGLLLRYAHPVRQKAEAASLDRPVSAEQAISKARQRAGRFPRIRLVPGYQAAEVDEFIARIEATLSGSVPSDQMVTAADVEAMKFSTTRRGGYVEVEVDKALDYYADGLDKLRG
jgi:DivIVA domain-containing protein